ncbi:MAG: hypothetical protein CTY24_06510 [Methylobacter sp.]|nr:MAG: hypothetical protein CTY24_06510 [Methylobacter sp.]
MDARAFSGFDNAGKSARLQADNLTLRNSSTTTTPLVTGNGSGSLDLIAGNYRQESGDININGFNTVNITANQQLAIAGNATLNVASNLNVTTGAIAGSGGQTLAINAVTRGTGGADVFHNVAFAGVQGAVQAANTNFGGGLAINAASIGLNNVNIDLPSGRLELIARQGDVAVTGQSDINLAGQAVSFADAIALTPGGSFSATSVNGRVTLAQGSTVDVSVAGSEANAGSLVLRAPQQTVELSGQLRAAGANVEIDVNDFGNSDFDGLITALTVAGADGDLSVRARNADIIQQASNIIAANIKLTADEGIIDIFGQLHADNSELNIQGLRTDGGVIALNAGGKITIGSSAVLTATGQNEGGRIILSSIADDGGIAVRQGSVLDVSGGARGGQVFFAAARSSSNGGADDDINIEALDGAVIGARTVYAQGVRTYAAAEIGNDNSIDSADIGLINSETAAYYTAAASQVATRFAGVGAQLSPDVEINYAGNLTLASAWNLADLRLNNGIPVTTVTLRAQGSLDINANLADGFDSNGLLSGTASSFQLVAGADTESADRLATRIIDTTSDPAVIGATLTIGTGASVHTGSGDITIVAAGDFELTDQTSTVFNAGRRDLDDPFGLYDGINLSPFGEILERFNINNPASNAEYPIDGGHTIISAGRNIKGAVTSQTFDGYIVRQGSIDLFGTTGVTPTAFGVNPLGFEQNIGSFGGGKVNIQARGDIADLAVILPTTGKQTGSLTTLNVTEGDAAGSEFPVPDNNQLDIQGGGVLQVNAGGNITGGIYYQGVGVGIINAGGSITKSTSTLTNAFTEGPQLLLSGNNIPVANNSGSINRTNTLSLSAGGDLNISGVTDAALLSTTADNFFSYSEASRVSLQSLGGNIALVKNGGVTSKLDLLAPPISTQGGLRDIYPASLDAIAFSGSVNLNSDVVLFPSTQSSVNIFARLGFNSVNESTPNEPFTIVLPDSSPDILSNAVLRLTNTSSLTTEVGLGLARDLSSVIGLFSVTAINGANSLPIGSNLGNSLPAFHANVPLHSFDSEPSRIVTLEGDISNVLITLSEQAVIQAGRDLINTPIRIQQSGQNQGSLIAAGRDIAFTTRVDSNGALRATDEQLIQVAGPGEVLFRTGRDFNLGTSEGVRSIGNTINPSLATTGANLSFLVGLNGNKPDYVGFINTYLANNPVYTQQFNQVRSLIGEFIRRRPGNSGLSDSDSLNAFASLEGDQLGSVQPQLNALIEQVFFAEIRTAGEASARTGNPSFNEQGYDVINTLFPDTGYQGDLTLFFSQIQTVVGGDINFLLPGGGVNAGLAVNPAGADNANGNKTADRLGVSVQDTGSINAFVNNNFEVNTSRLFTLNGGDILIWSSFGDIDAGRGPRASLAISFIDPPPPAPGVNLPRVASVTGGSGIRTSARPGQRQGDVLLFAPRGVVDAGEAGIAGNNVTLVATAVLGANNIQVSGVSTGVPTAPTSVVSGLTGTSNATANATQSAEQLAGLDDGSSAASKNTAALGLLSVDFLGFGE